MAPNTSNCSQNRMSTGDVHYKTLEIQLGAVVQGRLVHQDDDKAQKSCR